MLSIAGPVDETGELSIAGPVDGTGELSIAGPVDGTGELSIAGPVDGTGELSIAGPVDGTGELSIAEPVDGTGELLIAEPEVGIKDISIVVSSIIPIAPKLLVLGSVLFVFTVCKGVDTFVKASALEVCVFAASRTITINAAILFVFFLIIFPPLL
ncbi:MAG: hypothetical protein HDT30_01175 [Clostridiales bacterium]|nr:hypothetical protein [Clostridiales bacterium]